MAEQRSLYRALTLGLIALPPALLALFLMFNQGDVEAYLLSATEPAFPDAYRNLNSGFWTALTVFSCQSLIAMAVTLRNKRLLLIPLYTGTFIGACLFMLTFDPGDPHWFHLVALLSVGTFVSNLVVIGLFVFAKSQDKPTKE